MNWRNIRLIYAREIRDQLRDRRTLFMIAVLPLLLYPLLGTSVFQLSQFAMVVVVLQVMIGIANLLFYIPPAVTVVHQSVGILLLAVTSRLGFVAVRVSALEENPAAHRVLPEQTLPFSNSQHAGV